MSKEMVIFTRTYDLLLWLLPRCEKFPKAQRAARREDGILTRVRHI